MIKYIKHFSKSRTSGVFWNYIMSKNDWSIKEVRVYSDKLMIIDDQNELCDQPISKLEGEIFDISQEEFEKALRGEIPVE